MKAKLQEKRDAFQLELDELKKQNQNYSSSADYKQRIEELEGEVEKVKQYQKDEMHQVMKEGF